MSPERERPSAARGLFDQGVAAVTAAISGLLLTLVTVQFSGVYLRWLALGALLVLYLGVLLYALRRLFRTRYYDYRVALTGQPEAGKTVFANLLYDQLMNGNDADYEFTADSKSAIATYQAIRGLTLGEWPPATTRGAVIQRDGELRHGRVVVDLEIGDSAGQHWLALSEAADEEADYLQWVLSADALVHVIPADRIVAEGFDAVLRADVADLRLAVQLMRNVGKRHYVPVPILIVISKMDLLPSGVEPAELMRIFDSPRADQFRSTYALDEAGHPDAVRLMFSLSDELTGDFRSVAFAYASADIVRELRRIGSPHRPDIAAWIVEGAEGDAKLRRPGVRERAGLDLPRR